MNNALTICNKAKAGECDENDCGYFEPKMTSLLGVNGNCRRLNEHIEIILANSNDPNIVFKIKIDSRTIK